MVSFLSLANFHGGVGRGLIYSPGLVLCGTCHSSSRLTGKTLNGRTSLLPYFLLQMDLVFLLLLPTSTDHRTIVDLRSNLDCLEKVAIKLDQETPGLKNWYYFGWKFDIPIADLASLKPKRNPSPTKRMIEYVVHAEPHLTVRSFIQKLKRIERLDVVTALKKFFCGMYPSNNENTAFFPPGPG